MSDAIIGTKEDFVTKADFIAAGFKVDSENVYSRIDTQVLGKINDCNFAREQRVQFRIYQDSNPLGTNVECRIDGKLVTSGYWTNKKDFLSTFKL